MPRQNPYITLKNEFSAWVTRAINRRRVPLWSYPKERLSEGWSLQDLSERVAAANQLGYDVMLKHDASGLHVEYVQQLPGRPWGI